MLQEVAIPMKPRAVAYAVLVFIKWVQLKPPQVFQLQIQLFWLSNYVLGYFEDSRAF
ncbi:hypothetical protein F2Q70_00029665 [Brassica cretica]|uniref:Uncharacterized protein n=1 Tax=Brassica cretica TaxID=69181 RepID=A0A8S9FL18_BRACR|nr:hypothetical protein F2Q70_00029665 [Brassica cretica]